MKLLEVANEPQYEWRFGDYDLGEQESGKGTMEQMVAAAKKFSGWAVDLQNTDEIRLDKKEKHIIVGGDNEERPEHGHTGNILADGRYVIGSYKVK